MLSERWRPPNATFSTEPLKLQRQRQRAPSTVGVPPLSTAIKAGFVASAPSTTIGGSSPYTDKFGALFLGIDPGLNGGVAVVRVGKFSGLILETAIDIPTHGEGAKRRVDAAAFFAFVKTWAPQAAFIERAQAMPDQGSSSGFSYGRAVGTLEGVVACAGVALTIIEPSKWKKHYGLGKDKEASRQRAIQLFPDRGHFFVRKMDHQRAEAALIAVYGSKTPTL